MDIIVRQETDRDRVKIHELNAKAFGQDAEARLVDNLRRSSSFIKELSILAEMNGEIVGHILLSKIHIEGSKGTFESLALAPMAVDQRVQRKGIGKRLIETGLHKARELGFTSVIVVGHKGYYPKFGFMKAAGWGIRCPFEVPDDVFMAIELVPGSLKNKGGVVVYPKEFDEAT